MLVDSEGFGLPQYQSTQRLAGSPCKKLEQKKAMSQKADKQRSLKLREEGSSKWAEPVRTPIIANSRYEVMFNLHTGKHSPMLVSHEVNHEGITTEEELKMFEMNRGKFRHGFRVALEGNIGSGKPGQINIILVRQLSH